MKKTILVIFLLTFAFCLTGLNAQTLRFGNIEKKDKFLLSPENSSTNFLVLQNKTIQKSSLKDRLITESAELFDGKIKREGNKNFQDKPKTKSTWLAVGLSALLPGAGQFYAKNFWKAAIFLGIEAAAWGTFAYFRHKGNLQTESYQNYANSNWDVRQYARWLKEQNFEGSGGINPNIPDLELLRRQINECESQNFSHTLPEYYSQQYYEMIGKYQNFVAGWADAFVNGNWIVTKQNYYTYKTNMFNYYANERQKANDFYNYGDIGIYTVIINHILSAADAAWTVSIYNKEVKMKTGVGVTPYKSPYTLKREMIPTFKFSMNF